MRAGEKPNRLIHEKSPYLLQHAFNPVDWYPWGEEAFEKARREDKPIFLSVGYSTCYWCHVMERQVFEDTGIARLMNEKLVCIKVDREERPDIDRVYMAAVQGLTGGGGGWPMSVFLTPDLKPFYGATYIPPVSMYGRPGMKELVERLASAWINDRKSILESVDHVSEYLDNYARVGEPAESVTDSVLHLGFEHFAMGYDSVYGGFGGGPKFPRPAGMDYLLWYYSRTGNDSALAMTLSSLRKMADGGVYDHIAGGFHRYAVDAQWRVPHFEKMLYDQAQLISTYLAAYQITHDEAFAGVARGILNYVIGSMRDGEGGFYSAEDAESAVSAADPDSAEEGAFYVWTAAEIRNLLGKKQAGIYEYVYGIRDSGNVASDPMGSFVGKNILYVAHTGEEAARKFGMPEGELRTLLNECRLKLFAAREKRPHPHLDDKVITAWNGLIITAFSQAYDILGEERFLKGAEACAGFVMAKLYDPQTSTLRRRFRDGEARFEGTLQDYSFLSAGLVDLYEASFNPRWLADALTLTKKEIELFWDPKNGGFFDITGHDSTILLRTKDDYDGAEPTGNSVAVVTLLRLAQMTNNAEWRAIAGRAIESFGERLKSSPEGAPKMLMGIDWNLSSPPEIVVAGKRTGRDTKALLDEIHLHFIPKKVLILVDDGDREKIQSMLPFVTEMKMLDGKATAYVCRNYACQLPTANRAELSILLGQISPPARK